MSARPVSAQFAGIGAPAREPSPGGFTRAAVWHRDAGDRGRRPSRRSQDVAGSAANAHRRAGKRGST
jgi:hypothetical protein